jgi:preprotein translocase subunit SecY
MAAARTCGNGLLGMYSMFTGGGFERCAVGALGIMPYISATIILQLLQAVVPVSEQTGARRRRPRQAHSIWPRSDLVPLPGPGICHGHWLGARPAAFFSNFQRNLVLMHTHMVVSHSNGRHPHHRHHVAHVAGRADHRPRHRQRHLPDHHHRHSGPPAPGMARGWKDMFLTHRTDGRSSLQHLPLHRLSCSLLCAVVAGVVAVTQAERKIPVQYAQRVVGRKMYSGGSSFMPLRVNYSGVMPVIFASAILMFPTMILNFLGSHLPSRLRRAGRPGN